MNIIKHLIVVFAETIRETKQTKARRYLAGGY